MNSTFTLAAAGLVLWAFHSLAHAAPVFPIKPSADGRYLVDAQGAPFFYHADTAWLASKRLTLPEFEDYLDRRVKDGFTAIHLHAFSKEQFPITNRFGEAPFRMADKPSAPDGHDPQKFGEDIARPNEAYWRHFDAMLDAIERRGLLAVVAPMWIRSGGKDTDGWRWQLKDHLAEGYGRWLAARYAKHRNLLWVLGGDANPIEKTAAVDVLARGLKAVAPHHLITVHNRPEFSSAAYFDAASWLDVNFAYTYRETYIHVLGEWNRLGKRRPIVLSESGYEEESNDQRGGAPHRIRRQAYEAILSGALGGHAFGQKHLWKMDDQWRSALDAPAAKQMAHLKSLFASRRWWKLVPDQDHELVTAGYGYFGEVDYVTAALAEDGSFGMVYFPQTRKVSVNLGRLARTADRPVRASWFDPTSGAIKPVEDFPAKPQGTRELSPPEKNSAGDPDWVLVLEAVKQ